MTQNQHPLSCENSNANSYANTYAHWLEPASGQSSSEEPAFRIAIHGGAWDIPRSLVAAHIKGVEAAHARATSMLRSGASPLDVVVEVLCVLEDDPVFDAGHGSFLNAEGQVELDAAIMEGSGLRAGAVACLGAFANPSRVARAVMDHTDHVCLTGAGAYAFACEQGFVPLPPDALVHPRERLAFETWIKAGRPSAKVFFAHAENATAVGLEPDKRGTVGVVLAVKQNLLSSASQHQHQLKPVPGQGQYALFAGTSTGGIPGKRPGRVGDVPLVGCGLYADDWGGAAVSCTGWGEGLMRIAAAKSVSEKVKSGFHPQQAVEAVLQELWVRTQGRGGLIALDTHGRLGAAFTTPDMAFAGAACTGLAVSECL